MSRHALPSIGSLAWDKELTRRTGVRRAWVDEAIEQATGGRAVGGLDPHALWSELAWVDLASVRARSTPSTRLPRAEVLSELQGPSDEELVKALRLAAGVLLHEQAPGYALMMYLGHLLADVGYESPAGRWGAYQLATMMLRGPDAVQASAEYFLCMDVFGNAERAAAVFPRLAAALPRALHERLLSLSSCVAWPTKKPFYEKLALRPELHAALARALLGSCTSGWLRSADAGDVRALLAGLRAVEPGLVASVEAATGQPIRATVLAALVPGTSTPRGLARSLVHPGRYLVRLDFHTELYTWLIGSELWWSKRRLGSFAAFRCFIEPDARASSAGFTLLVSELEGYERLWIDPEGPTSDGDIVRWHAIDGPPGEVERLLGQQIELWAPGMRALATP